MSTENAQKAASMTEKAVSKADKIANALAKPRSARDYVLDAMAKSLIGAGTVAAAAYAAKKGRDAWNRRKVERIESTENVRRIRSA